MGPSNTHKYTQLISGSHGTFTEKEKKYLPNLSTMSRMWHEVSFKQSRGEGSSLFKLEQRASFSTTGCQTKVKEHNYRTIYPYLAEE